MNPGKHKKPRSSPSAEPISWHSGWQEISPPVAERAASEAGGRSGEAGERPAEAGEPPAETRGQPADLYGEDQPRFGVEHQVRLSTEPTVLMHDGSREQQYLSVSLEQQADDTAPRVVIGHNGVRATTATVNEARRFALDILGLVNGLHHPEV